MGGTVLSKATTNKGLLAYVPLQLIQRRPQMPAEVGEKLLVCQREQATVHLDLVRHVFGVTLQMVRGACGYLRRWVVRKASLVVVQRGRGRTYNSTHMQQ